MFNVDEGCVDVDIMIEQYDKYLSDLLDKHAPNNNIYVVYRPSETYGRKCAELPVSPQAAGVVGTF